MEGLSTKTRRWYLLVGIGLGALAALGIWAASYQRKMRQPSLLTGQVLAATGRPVAGARIHFVRGPVALPDVALLTDANGAFTLSAPAPGTYQLGCIADGFAATTVAVDVTAGQPAKVEIHLH